MRKRACVLTSGGLDSAMLIGHYLDRGFRVTPVYVHAGLRWERVEEAGARRFLRGLRSPRVEPLRTIRVDARDLYPKGHWAFSGRVPGPRSAWDSVFLPGRNILLLSKAGVLCRQLRIDRLAMAPVGGNPFPDAQPEFFAALSKALRLGLKMPRFRIEAPFLGKKKPKLMRRAARLPLHLTYSCIRPIGTKHCGVCAKCYERRDAFRESGIPDRTRYEKTKGPGLPLKGIWHSPPPGYEA